MSTEIKKKKKNQICVFLSVAKLCGMASCPVIVNWLNLSSDASAHNGCVFDTFTSVIAGQHLIVIRTKLIEVKLYKMV